MYWVIQLFDTEGTSSEDLSLEKNERLPLNGLESEGGPLEIVSGALFVFFDRNRRFYGHRRWQHKARR